MKLFLKKMLSEFGMILVLLLLCAWFSVATYSDQSPAGEAGARQVAADIAQLGRAPRVLVVSGNQPGDAAFVATLSGDLSASGATIVATSRGEPQAAREAMQTIVAAGGKLDAIACTQSAGSWLVFSDLRTDFPTLGEPLLITPRSYRWPNFLKTENLLNIANQIAIIAIIAIGMTMVIITGGIDLSVGSLLALSAVLAARFIRDYAGGVGAPVGGMILAGLAAVAICGAIGAFSGFMITRFRIPPFIVTLAMMLVGSGLAYTLAAGQSIYQLPDSFIWLGRGAGFFSIPNAVVLMC
jgi:ribose transport system permease protein